MRQGLDRALQARVGVDGVLPDLVGVGGQVDLGVVVAVQDAGLLVVQVDARPGRSSSSSKNASSVPTTSAFSLQPLARRALRRRMMRSTPSAGRKE